MQPATKDSLDLGNHVPGSLDTITVSAMATPVRRPLTLAAVEAAFRASFARDSCAEDDLPLWSPENPARGHCAVAALTVNDLFGGELLLATVERDGVRTGYHYWNRLAGLDVDLTADQFLPGEVINEPEALARPAGRPTMYADQYDAFRTRVFGELGLETRISRT